MRELWGSRGGFCMSNLNRALGVIASSLALLSGAALGAPVRYEWSGVFEPGGGALNSRSFTIGFTVPDPSVYGAEYHVDASLAIGGIGAWQQEVVFDFSDYVATTVGLGGFTDILQPGDSLFFGICSGGSCNDPVLWNANPSNPVLNTGTFSLGLDSSCTFPGGCNNAIANWFDGQGGGTTARYLGALVVTSVPEPSSASLLALALAVSFLVDRRIRRRGRAKMDLASLSALGY